MKTIQERYLPWSLLMGERVLNQVKEQAETWLCWNIWQSKRKSFV